MEVEDCDEVPGNGAEERLRDAASRGTDAVDEAGGDLEDPCDEGVSARDVGASGAAQSVPGDAVEEASAGREGLSQEEATVRDDDPQQGLSAEFDVAIADEEEGAPARGIPSPVKVSKEEYESHMLTHTPFRSWCEYCVRGRGRKNPHYTQSAADKRKDRAARKVPRVSMDYFFFNQSDEDAASSPILVMVD